ncbi:MAG TPA: ABC transporter permease, partial [Firmicutes bacterium]|nr:ABC transporter permease [Bacillota bacterium]
IMSSGVGVRTTIDLTNGLKYGLDWPGQYWGNDLLLRPTLPWAIIGMAVALAVGIVIYQLRVDKRQRLGSTQLVLAGIGLAWACWWSVQQIQARTQINWIRVPLLTWLVIAGACVGLHFFSRTKLGQDMRSVGQDRHVAAVAGIDVNRVRIAAIILSMVMAAWGHIIFLQNIGTFSTYGSHEQVGLYSAAALLIGGATVARATIGHALLGTLLFHTLFIVAPAAGRQLFGDAQIGEYFRVFVAYGIIGITLAMHAWKQILQRRSVDQ